MSSCLASNAFWRLKIAHLYNTTTVLDINVERMATDNLMFKQNNCEKNISKNFIPTLATGLEAPSDEETFHFLNERRTPSDVEADHGSQQREQEVSHHIEESYRDTHHMTSVTMRVNPRIPAPNSNAATSNESNQEQDIVRDTPSARMKPRKSHTISDFSRVGHDYLESRENNREAYVDITGRVRPIQTRRSTFASNSPLARKFMLCIGIYILFLCV